MNFSPEELEIDLNNAIASLDLKNATLGHVADNSGMSADEIERKIQECGWLGFDDYLSFLRLEFVLKMGQAGYSIDPLLLQAGFADRGEFVSAYERHYIPSGLTPEELITWAENSTNAVLQIDALTREL